MDNVLGQAFTLACRSMERRAAKGCHVDQKLRKKDTNQLCESESAYFLMCMYGNKQCTCAYTGDKH